MNTLFDQVAANASRGRQIQSFLYPVVAVSHMELGELCSDEASAAARELTTKRDIEASVLQARSEGVRQGEAQASASTAETMEKERAGLAAALEDFSKQRVEYFRAVESEVVHLALAIARKVLHREAQLDPLLLAGVVRVALEQVQNGTHVALRTAVQAAGTWQEYFQKHPEVDRQIEVIADPSFVPHRLTLETETASAEISLDSQLHEIESGFFDLLLKRPEQK